MRGGPPFSISPPADYLLAGVFAFSSATTKPQRILTRPAPQVGAGASPAKGVCGCGLIAPTVRHPFHVLELSHQGLNEGGFDLLRWPDYARRCHETRAACDASFSVIQAIMLIASRSTCSAIRICTSLSRKRVSTENTRVVVAPVSLSTRWM